MGRDLARRHVGGQILEHRRAMSGDDLVEIELVGTHVPAGEIIELRESPQPSLKFANVVGAVVACVERFGDLSQSAYEIAPGGVYPAARGQLESMPVVGVGT